MPGKVPMGKDSSGKDTAAAENKPAEGAAPEPTFEEALARLEELVRLLEEGDLSLEASIRTFEEGQKLLRLCSELLGKAEQRVQTIMKKADGGMEETEWKGEADA